MAHRAADKHLSSEIQLNDSRYKKLTHKLVFHHEGQQFQSLHVCTCHFVHDLKHTLRPKSKVVPGLN